MHVRNKNAKKNLPENQKDITMSGVRNLKVQNQGVGAYGNQHKEKHHD